LVTGRESERANEPLRRSEGLVLRTEANFCSVLTDEGDEVQVNVPRRLKMGERTTTTPVVIGDRVRVRMEPGNRSGVVEEVCKRRNQLYRLAPGRTGIKDVLAANLDDLIVVQALRMPDFNAAQLDRFLAIAEQAEIPATIVLNKCDLAEGDEAVSIAADYSAIGYPVVCASAKADIGIEAVRAALKGICAVIGPSGVGKSTLINRISPGLRLKTSEVSDLTGKGRHTTVLADLLPLGDGDYVADTPGLRSIGLVDLDKYEVASLFKEMQSLIGACRFADCLHKNEPGCAVRGEIEAGRLSARRYASYLKLMDEVREGFRQDWETGRGQ
jgi:ribosome biogenesis GTPase